MSSSTKQPMRLNRRGALDFWDNSDPDRKGIDPKPEVNIQQAHEEVIQPEPQGNVVLEDVDTDSDDEDSKKYNDTCVTPLIADIVQTLYRGLKVAGNNSRKKTIDSITTKEIVENQEYIKYMDRLLAAVIREGDVHPRKCRVIRFNPESLIRKRSRHVENDYYSSVTIDGLVYHLGDIVMMPAGKTLKEPQPEFPDSASESRDPVMAGNLFWFAKILSINSDQKEAHVQWFSHSSKTVLGELGHPQELFLSNECDDVSLDCFVAKCPCRRFKNGERPDANRKEGFMVYEFFYSMLYDTKKAVFRDILETEDNPIQFVGRPDSCRLCSSTRGHNRNVKIHDRRYRNATAQELVISAVKYHVNDDVYVRSTDGPCHIGKIITFEAKDDICNILIKLYGRMNDRIRESETLEASVYEDRHLFLTEETIVIQDNDLLRKIFVVPKAGINNLSSWVKSSPDHYYITKRADTLVDGLENGLFQRMRNEDFILCELCIDERRQETEDFLAWKRKTKNSPLRVFDPFSGCGAFALSACSVGNMKFTHAIDIDPSATMTLSLNSLDTTVYNQCSNLMLEYAVKHQTNFGWRNELKDVHGLESLPEPPTSDDIDCIISGFPCQPHSSLNQFKKASHPLNELLLNTLSWVDLIRPKYVLFENVEGFVSHEICAVQKTTRIVRGGIQKGGIKLLCKALICMGYQVRFGLLQAACYGTPQSRVRFFMWGAKSGLVLPEFPLCSHDFTRERSLKIQFENGTNVNPVQPTRGTAPHPFVTVKDAISDLPKWDWKNPHVQIKRTQRDVNEERSRRANGIKTYKRKEWWCGINEMDSEDEDSMPYEHAPRCAFQARCRKEEPTTIQHITDKLNDFTYESVCNIPFGKGANYKSLNAKAELWQYQSTSAQSATGKRGYGNIMYERLEPDGHFNTIVTNIGPTAKQSRVLHPWCKRICTVREWARGQGFPDNFEFVAHNKKVKSMHRLIGNAVPWPLGEALGRELEQAMYKQYLKEEEIVEA